ncbi:hypothetical protein LJC20_02675 [Eubacteriales bacterium OttesenSCG-928-M02]|nr:hypothetical protein [Eubacteriales bacterium OttesenSCG-928-M02]
MRRSCLFVFLALSLVLLSACSGKNTSGPTQSFQAYLDALQKGDLETASQYVQGGIQKLDGADVLYDAATPFYATLKANITEESINGNSATLTVELTMLDAEILSQNILTRIAADGHSLDTMDDALITLIAQALREENLSGYDTFTDDPQQIPMVKEGDKWLIPQDYDLSSSIVYTFVTPY